MQISLNEISKTYTDAARELCIIEDLSYDFPQSGTVGLVGRSGIGKSTLLHAIGGLDRPTAGTVTFDDIDIYSLRPDDLAKFRGENVGFIFQFHHLLPEFTALENVAMPLIIQGKADQICLSDAEEILIALGLKDRLHHRPAELSGGEQQRVSIARAMVAKPKVILADEPTGNLDYRTAAEIQDLIFNLNKDMGSLLVAVTHSRELVANLDLVLEMQPGGDLKVIK